MGLSPRVVIVSPQLVGLSARRLRDAVLVERIGAVDRDNYGVYGVRKMWHALYREGIVNGREHTARLMRLAGVCGKGKDGSPITTRTPQRAGSVPGFGRA
ncbi:IS3 family transposase [Corynebacterium propinquum]|uniref:IS3 family transposase n=1 Tax=Corynebacterium propinquum TaxID=43769 RepID=UPI003D6CBDAF